MAKTIAVLGSTGSIGVQTLEVAQSQGYRVKALAAGSNIELLARQAAHFRPELVALQNEQRRPELSRLLSGIAGYAPTLLSGEEAAAKAAGESGADIVLNAIVGIAGLSATLAAAAAGADIALANKESLVAGGQLVMDAVAQKSVRLLPVDSEHSAIFQCLQDPYTQKALRRIWLTASGGPFYGQTANQLRQVTAQDALRHPNWAMGAKITVDSATLMNKGLELIEAMWLFDLPPQQISILVQRESVIHSMVELADGSVLAQLGAPDMRIPIQYALTWPHHSKGPANRLDFTQLSTLHFGQPDVETFRCLAACQVSAAAGGLAACAANGANEEAVALFLQGAIPFLEIGRLVEAVVERGGYGGAYTLADVYACDAEARAFVRANKKGT